MLLRAVLFGMWWLFGLSVLDIVWLLSSFGVVVALLFGGYIVGLVARYFFVDWLRCGG